MARYSLADVISSIINFIFGLIVVGLAVRFILRLLGANPESGFAAFVYNSTAPLLDPFKGIFSPYTLETGSVLEFSTLVAIIVYLFIAWLLNELIAAIVYNSSTTYRRPRDVV